MRTRTEAGLDKLGIRATNKPTMKAPNGIIQQNLLNIASGKSPSNKGNAAVPKNPKGGVLSGKSTGQKSNPTGSSKSSAHPLDGVKGISPMPQNPTFKPNADQATEITKGLPGVTKMPINPNKK